MVALGRLRFRRHLLACLLAALLGETLRMAAGGEQRRIRVRLASAEELAGDNLQAVYGRDARPDQLGLWAALADRLGSLVPVINLNYSIANSADRFSASGQSDAQVDAYYDEKFPADMRLDELQLMSVRAADRMAPTPMHISWGYASRQLARLGSQPVGDERLCALQLAHLVKRLEQALRQAPMEEPARGEPGGSAQVATPVDNFEARQMYRTADLELMRLLDTFGKVPSEVLRGNTRWYGGYESCLKMRLRPPGARNEPALQQADGQQAIRFRYCMGAYRSQAWPESRRNQAETGGGTNRSRELEHFIRIGLCLPEACDSNALELKDNWRALERLAKFNLVKPFNSDHYKLEQLYCVPDERSPLRRIPAGGWLLLLALGGWLLLVAGATLVQLNVDKFYLKTVGRVRRQQKRQQSGSPPRERAKTNDEEDDEHEDGERLGESDILDVKLNVIKLNVYIRDKSRRIVPGVDLIDCLSFYSNWLRYTRRLKLAIVRQHEHELERQKRARESELAARRLVERNGAARGPADNKATGGLALKLGLADEQVAGRESAPVVEGVAGPEVGARDGRLRRVDTSALNALKVVALTWIIAGHCIFYLASAISNGANLRDVLPTLGVFALTGGALYITELFFVITGCLTSYLVFRRITRLAPRDELEAAGANERLELRPTFGARASAPISPPRGSRQQFVALMDGRMFGLASLPYFGLLVVSRYLRIMPTYLLVYALVKLVGVYASGEGQLWDYAVSENSVRRACVQESWWPVLTLTSNFVHIYKHCIVGGWYLSADMQFALLSVPLLLLLAHSQRGAKAAAPNKSAELGEPAPTNSRPPLVRLAAATLRRLAPAYALISGLALVSLALAVVNTWLYSQVDFSYLVKFTPHTIAIMSQNILMYTNSVFRARAFLAGLLLGHLLYLYEFKLMSLPPFVQRHGSKLTLAIFLLGFTLMFSTILMHGKLVVSHDVTALLTVLNAGAIDLFLCSLIFLVCIGKAPKAVLFCLNSPMWSLLSSLSLSAFLVHAEIIILLTSRLDPPPSVSHALLVLVLSATLILTYSLAFVLYLAFEMPISRLIAGLVQAATSGGRRSREPSDTTTREA